MKEFIGKLSGKICNMEDKEIVVQGDKKMTEKQFYQAVRCARTIYEKQGIVKGDRVLLMIPVGIPFYVTLFSVWAIGAAAVLIDPDMEQPEIEMCMKRTDVKKIICVDKTRRFRKGLEGWKMIACSLACDWDMEIKTMEVADLKEDKEAIISFTSEGAGIPKGTVRTFGFLGRQKEVMQKHFLYKKTDTDFSVMPMFTITNFLFGMKTILSDVSTCKEENVPFIAEQMIKENVNRILLTPFLAKGLAEYAKNNYVEFPSVETVFLGGGPVYKKIIQEAKRLFPYASIYLVYGCAEAEPIALFHTDKITEKQYRDMSEGEGLIGGALCLPCMIIKNEPDRKYGTITEEEWKELQLENSVGEIVVSGNHVLSNYIDGIGGEEHKICVGNTIWHRTGDLGRMKEDGLLYLYGRSKEAVFTHGIWFYPFSVESRVYENYEVEKAAYLLYEGKTTLAVQAKKQECEKIDAQKAASEYDIVIPAAAIPMDRKHQSKIDYTQLRTYLNKDK